MTSPQDTLQGYFDDLLISDESALVAEPEPRPMPETRPKERVASPAQTQSAPVHEPREQRLAREKLAKLLVSSPLKPAAQVEEVVEVAPQEVLTEVANPVAEPVDSAQMKNAPLELSPEITESQEEPVQTDEELNLAAGLAWADNGRPQWAQERFDVLLFEVAGLTLAVPLISLGQIQPLTDELTPLFGQADWFMGLQPTPVGKIRTINTAKFVMPERYCDSFLEAAKYVVSINGLPWGLAVDAVNQPISLDPEDVKWRSERGKRPWLAGTVKQHMCALLDVATMGQLLSEADKPESKGDPLADR